MNTVNQFPLAYTKFLDLVQSAQAMPLFPRLEPVEERILNQLAIQWNASPASPCVNFYQALEALAESSPKTLQRRLNKLADKGLIAFRPIEGDRRGRWIEPTPLARQYFTQLGHCLQLASRLLQ